MTVPQIVIDTNVLIAAFRSRNGASFRLLSMIDSGRFEINLSVPIVLEYEDVLSRAELGVLASDISHVIDYLCAVGNKHPVYFLWRPFLNDPNDEMVLELAVVANCDYIVTFNERDFRGAESFGLQVIRPIQFLRLIGEN
jgi:putative PIN family toxin of toxin-antitoxin system